MEEKYQDVEMLRERERHDKQYPPEAEVTPRPAARVGNSADGANVPAEPPARESQPDFKTTAENDRHYICEIGRIFWGDDKDCYAADAVFRKVETTLASLRAQLAQAQQEREAEEMHLGSAKVRVRKMLDKPDTDTQALAPMLSQLEAKLKRLTAAALAQAQQERDKARKEAQLLRQAYEAE